jgi:transketolase
MSCSLRWRNWTGCVVRDAFVNELTQLAARDASTMLITGDLGFGVLTEYAERFPDQYLNAGVAEQNMTGLAAGMALEGRRVFTYSIANFPTLRCIEQIRNDICYHNLPVTIVSVGGGFAYGSLGFSHHATEDVAMMGVLPGMRVLAPNDPQEVVAATRIAGNAAGPTYLRLGRNGEPHFHQSAPELSGGRLIPVGEIKAPGIAIIAGCGALDIAIETQQLLTAQGLDSGVWSSPWIEPFDVKTTAEIARSARLIVTIEEHSVLGGVGTRVSHVCAELDQCRARVLVVGIPRQPIHEIGDQPFMRRAVGLCAIDIVARILPLR